MNFFNLERVDMVMLYGAADGNARLARELWIAHFPNRPIPCTQTFTSVQHLQAHGTFKPQTHDRGRPKEYCKLKNKFWNGVEEKVQALGPADFRRRVIYCEWLS